MANKGTLTMADLRAARFSTAAEIGLDTINATLQADLSAWEAQVNEAVSAFAETTTERQRIWGSSAVIEMEELDELGRPTTKKQSTGQTQGFRLNRFASSVGYSDMWFKTHKAFEMAENQLKVQRGHNERILKEIKKAIYINNATGEVFKDWLVDNVELNVKSFVNGEAGTLIPDAPNSTKFAATHNHYIARAGGALAASDVDSLVTLVSEHGFGGIALFISLSDLTTLSALSGFTKLAAPQMEYHVTDVTSQRMDVTADPSNRLVGFWGENMIPVYTRPWCIATYIVGMALEAAEKPLVRRQHTVSSLQGLRLEGTFEQYPLHADAYVALEGYSVWNRIAGAVLMNAAAYSNPEIA
jgi:hypothetical protein